ncbi:MAG: M23 family metallopeptidase [Candidatus Gracilibacteria bacterium]|jgi:murein DD-endopeptidase MepM/ murein hydrolase activator NlpD
MLLNVEATTLEVNKFAQKSRHLKIFSNATLIWIHAKDAVMYLYRPVSYITHSKPFIFTSNLFSSALSYSKDLMPTCPQKKLIFQSTILSLTAFLVSSFTPGADIFAVDMTYSTDYISSYEIPGDVLVADENGFLIKINPQTNEANRVGMTDYAVHSVESGDSLSLIAERYSLKPETIMWENNISNANALRVGQKLMIPPIDGISYKIKSGDNLSKIAKKYSIDINTIIAQNNLDSEYVAVGQNIFLPGAKPIANTNIAGNYRTTAAARSARSYANVSDSNATPVGDKPFIYPTIGKISQGYRGGHYAVDIADRSKPAVWAAGGGTVIKASSGTWGGGYGNHVIIDHGNGLHTLYAHLDSLNVTEGQYVNQGDVIGIMGNTGRVYGATGIHLHFEVIDNGVKKFPGNYY